MSNEISKCPFCGSAAEMREWDETDAKRWAAQIKCTGCGAEGPMGYANNHLGCYDAVNDLHKDRALAGWNRRPEPSEALKAAIDKLIYTAWYSGEQDGSEGVKWEERGDSYNGMLRDQIQTEKKALMSLLTTKEGVPQ